MATHCSIPSQKNFMLYSKIKYLSPDPVVDAIVELRFTPTMPKTAVFGVLYNALGDEYKANEESLPVTQIPEHIRLKDSNFHFKPWYRLTGSDIKLLVGPDVLAITGDCTDGYMGWSKFFDHIQKILDQVQNGNIVQEIGRIGVRYISFFEDVNIFDKLTLRIQAEESDRNFTAGATSFTTTLEENGFFQQLNVKNDAQRALHQETLEGSIIDIDTFCQQKLTDFGNVREIIDQGHESEKSLFFSLLDKDFLASLNPVYEDQK